MTRVVVVQPSLHAISETFIRAHADGLKAHVIHLQGGMPAIEGIPTLPQDHYNRLKRRVMRGVRRWSEKEITIGFQTALRLVRAEVVLAEYGEMGVMVLDACESLRLPLVVHFHGYDATRHDVLARHRDSYRRMFRQAAAIIVVSQTMNRQLIHLGCPPDKIVYIPYGVNCNEFQGADPGKAPPRFLSVGRMVEKKAPYLTLAAFQLALRDIPDARLRMIGDGVLLPVCKDLAVALGIDHAVEFLGSQPHRVVQDEMGHARAFVQHSITAADGDCEGTPVAILEAGMAGLPVVATRHAGITDVVREDETGILVDERDVAGMANGIIALASDPSLAGRLGKNAAQHISRYYRMDQSIAKLSLVLEAAANRRLISSVKIAIERQWPDATTRQNLSAIVQ